MEPRRIDVFDPDLYVTGVPHDTFALLRREAPVFWHPEPGGPGFWAVTRHRDVFAVSTDPRTFSSARGGALLRDPGTEQDLQQMQLMMLNMDPPRHTKLRNLVSKGFTPRVIARLETQIRAVTTRTIRAGDKVVVSYVSANRDEAVFVAPGRFDIRRAPNEHLAFGIGTHFCLGSSLARLEIRILFEELLRRLPDIDLGGPVRRLRSNFINGIKGMPIRYTPERGHSAARV